MKSKIIIALPDSVIITTTCYLLAQEHAKDAFSYAGLANALSTGEIAKYGDSDAIAAIDRNVRIFGVDEVAASLLDNKYLKHCFDILTA